MCAWESFQIAIGLFTCFEIQLKLMWIPTTSVLHIVFNTCAILFSCRIYQEIIYVKFFGAVLLWLLTAACIKTGRPHIARRAIELAESRLSKDHWPEYYDGKLGRYVGKQSRKFQTWSIAGYLVAKMMLEDPSHLGMISLEEDNQKNQVIKRSASWSSWFFLVYV